LPGERRLRRARRRGAHRAGGVGRRGVGAARLPVRDRAGPPVGRAGAPARLLTPLRLTNSSTTENGRNRHGCHPPTTRVAIPSGRAHPATTSRTKLAVATTRLRTATTAAQTSMDDSCARRVRGEESQICDSDTDELRRLLADG